MPADLAASYVFCYLIHPLDVFDIKIALKPAASAHRIGCVDWLTVDFAI
jgi:hypothetical protein